MSASKTNFSPVRFEAGRTLVAPSILSADFARMSEELARLEAAGADWVHVDVMDGMFVPNITMGPPIIKALRKHSRLPFDVHLMIEKPERYLQDFRDAGADVLTVHAETCPHLHRTLAQIREMGCRAGVSLNPSTPVNVIENVMDDLDLVLIMSVNPGFGGQSFIPKSLDKLKQVKALIGDRPVHLEVDGGISPKNAEAVRKAGANVLVAGSAVFGADDMQTAIQAIRGDVKNYVGDFPKSLTETGLC
jgi:ribulose-phosphate 3-epimerase